MLFFCFLFLFFFHPNMHEALERGKMLYTAWPVHYKFEVTQGRSNFTFYCQ